MITDARVLQQEFIPKEIQHRDSEVNYLSSILEPITRDGTTEPTLLYGPSGVGKTCIAQFIVEKLRESVVELNYQYVNCWENHTRFRTLYKLLEGINQTFDIHRQSTPRDVLLDRLREYNGPPYIVILDEVDQLQDKELLYDLHRIRNLTMILIANKEEDLFRPLDERLSSRLKTANRIQFSQYTKSELVSILRDRSRWGLDKDVIGTPELEQIAEHAAGDARVAIGILRKAARTTHQKGINQVQESVITDVVLEAKMEIERQTINRLTPHQKMLYNIITAAEKIDPPSLYERYSNRVDDPKTERTVRNYLAKLEHYNLIISEGNTKARTYRTP